MLLVIDTHSMIGARHLGHACRKLEEQQVIETESVMLDRESIRCDCRCSIMIDDHCMVNDAHCRIDA